MIHKLDVCGLRCPMPVLKARQALKALAVGEKLHVIATDPASMDDFRVFVQQTGHKLLHSEQRDALLHFWIEKTQEVRYVCHYKTME